MLVEHATSLLIIIAIGVVALLVRSFLPTYVGEKGRNLATKEDIGEITRAVEAVKDEYAAHIKELEHQNALVLEQLRSQQQLRLAAVEKRLVAHQEAFALWRKLIANSLDESLPFVVIECQDWWNKNCLFLSAEARDAFNRSYSLAQAHRQLATSGGDIQIVKRYAEIIVAAGDLIVAGVELPSLGARETQQAEVSK